MKNKVQISALVAGLIVFVMGWTMTPASATPWYQSFYVHDQTSGANEAVNLTLDLGTTLETGFGGFQGYLVMNLLSGSTQDGNPLLLVAAGSAGFNGNPNDNLFNPDSSSNYFSGGGLGYIEDISGGEAYQLFFSTADNRLEGCWNRSPCTPFVILQFQSSSTPLPPLPPLGPTPLPASWLMLLGGLAVFGFVAYRGSNKFGVAFAAP
jgi:hypothetical protein